MILNQVDGATPRLRRRMAQMANITSMKTTTMAAIILPTMAPACLWCSFVSPFGSGDGGGVGVPRKGVVLFGNAFDTVGGVGVTKGIVLFGSVFGTVGGGAPIVRTMVKGVPGGLGGVLLGAEGDVEGVSSSDLGVFSLWGPILSMHKVEH